MPDFVQDRKLPVVATVSEVFGGSFLHFFNLLSIAWFPLALLLAMNIGVILLLPTATDPSNAGAFAGSIFAFQIASIFLYAMVAVVWHRRVLLGENPSGPIYFKIGKREIFFILYLLLITLFAVLIVGVAAGLAVAVLGGLNLENATPGAIMSAGVVAVVGYVLFLYVYLRSALVLPAVAVGQKEPLRTSWAITKGNVWRLIGGFLVILLAYFVVSGIVFAVTSVFSSGSEMDMQGFMKILSGQADTSTLLFYQIINMVFSVYLMMVSITYLSVCYRHLSDGVDASADAVFGDGKV